MVYSLAPVGVGWSLDGSATVRLDWRNRAVRVTGAIDVGKSLFIRGLLDSLDGQADVIGYAGAARDALLYPEFFHFGELAAFHDALISLVQRRMEGDTARPLVIVADKWSGTKGPVLDDIRRVARYAEEWNAYILLEDRNRAQGPFRSGFNDIKPTAVTMARGEGIIAYSKTTDLVRFKNGEPRFAGRGVDCDHEQ